MDYCASSDTCWRKRMLRRVAFSPQIYDHASTLLPLVKITIVARRCCNHVLSLTDRTFYSAAIIILDNDDLYSIDKSVIISVLMTTS